MFLFSVDGKIMLTILPLVVVMFVTVGVVIGCVFCNNRKNVKYHRRFVPHSQHAYNSRYSRRRMHSQSIEDKTATILHSEITCESTVKVPYSKLISKNTAISPHSDIVCQNTATISHSEPIGEKNATIPHRHCVSFNI